MKSKSIRDDLTVLSDPIDKETHNIALVTGWGKGFRCFALDQNHRTETDIHVICNSRPDRRDPPIFFINVSKLETFLDETQLKTTHVEDYRYEVMQCILCMERAKKLYGFDLIEHVHFHKDCYHELVTAVKTLIENNTEPLVTHEV